MKTWLTRILIAVPLILFLLLATGYFVLKSQTGSRWLLNTIVDYSEQPVSLNGISGSILSRLTIENIELDICEMKLSISNFILDWQPANLSRLELKIHQITSDQLSIDLNEDCKKEPSQEKFTLPDKISLPISVTLDHFKVNEIIFTQGTGSPQRINNLQLTTSINEKEFLLDVSQLNYETLNLRSSIIVLLNSPYVVNGNTQWQFTQEDKSYDGNLEINGNKNSLILTHDLTNPYTIHSRVVMNDPFGEVSISSNSQWDTITIPIDSQQTIKLRHGLLTTTGTIKEAHYKIDSLFDTTYAENIKVSAEGKASNSDVSFFPLKILHKNTTLNANGILNFSDALSLQLDIIGRDIDPSIFIADYPGNLQVNTSIEYALINQRNLLQMDIQKLSGNLRGFPLMSSGSIQSDLTSTKLNDIRFSIGNNNINVNGSIAKTIALDAEVSANNLTQLHNDLSGDINGTIKLSGDFEKPNVVADLASKNLNYQDLFSASKFNLTLAINDDLEQTLNAQIELDQLDFNKQNIEDIKLQLDGTFNHHTLQTQLSTQYGKLSLMSQGNYQPLHTQWQGTLEEILIRDSQFGDWSNKGIANVSINKESQSIDSLCLEQILQTICASFANDESHMRKVAASINNINLDHTDIFLGDYGSADGTVSGQIDLSTNDEGLWLGRTSLETDDLVLLPPNKDILQTPFIFETVQLDFELDELSLFKMEFSSNYGNGSAQSSIIHLQNNAEVEIKHGYLKLALPKLDFINAYIKDMVIKNGHADTNLQFNGPISRISLAGEGKIDALDFYLPELGTEYQNAQLTFDANNMRQIDINGNLFAEEGNLTLNGWISLDDVTLPKYQFTVKGENFPVMDSIDVKASITPDLTLAGTPNSIAINGSLLVPVLNIILKSLPDGIDAVSEDEIIVDDEEQLEKETFIVTGNIDASLGEQAKFTGYGLQTDLTGRLNVSLQEHQPTTGHGTLSMVNASYVKFGQALDIKKGKIIFSGPLENPSLDIEIERGGSAATVTMSITGRADDPTTKLTSNPALSEANKLSYLLTGRLVNELNSGEGTNLTQAALALGLSKSSSTIQELGNKFGLDTLSVAAGDDGLQSTSLLLGKHLSPKLYITYAKDIFSALGAVQMNYRLTDNLSLEVESGTRQTVDLIYSIKTD